MYIFLKWTSSNSTLVTNYLSKYTWKLEFAGVLYQLRFVQPSCLCGFADLFLAIALAPFICAAPPSNHHKSCNRNTHICSTAHRNRTRSSHYTPKTSLLSEVASLTVSSTHRGAHTQSQIAQCLEYPGATQWQTAVMTNHPKKNHRSPPPPRSLLPSPYNSIAPSTNVRILFHRCGILADHKKNNYNFGKKRLKELLCVTLHQGICDERDILTCAKPQLWYFAW